MITTDVDYGFNSLMREIKGLVELYNGSTLSDTFRYDGLLSDIIIERQSEEGKFFGFGFCQKATVKLKDINNEASVAKGNALKIYLGNGTNFECIAPLFYVSEIVKDQKTGELSITAYDKIYGASAHTVEELGLSDYTIEVFAAACASLLDVSMVIDSGITDDCFSTYYESGANFDGTETIRDALNAVAEATQSIYYLNYDNNLVFKRLGSGGTASSIYKANYFDLQLEQNYILTSITHATELGDNVTATTGEAGVTQYVRNNPFWELREDIDTLVENALSAIGGLSIYQFASHWRGNFLIEPGDKLGLMGTGAPKYSYLLNDSITYDGGFSQLTSWNYNNNVSETASNPSTLGEAIKQTYAKVDKANKEIGLVASETSSNSERIASLEINTQSINATVSELQESTNSAVEDINGNVAELTKRVDASITAADVNLAIKSEISNGVDKVVTATGFTFNEEGLSISKTGSEMTTQITEDGMTVYRDNTAVLTANNVGVDAVNLHATTYLIIGTNSRFENYGTDRTGCFWIGG